MTPQEIRQRVESCLEAVGLYDVAHLYPSELSGGMQKRVSFARALVDDPERGDQAMPLLLYDEPTAGLDPVACTRIEDLIVKTTTVARGCSVVVSHVRSTIERSAERVMMLYGSSFRWEGSVAEFRTTTTPMWSSSGQVACADPCSPWSPDRHATQHSRCHRWFHSAWRHRRIRGNSSLDAWGAARPAPGR